MFDYAVQFHITEESGIAVLCRDLPELNSYGDDEAHAFAEVIDAIETTLSLYADQRRSIPKASPAQPGEHRIHLPLTTVAKIELWNTLIERDMRKSDLRRLLNCSQTTSDRLLDFLHTSRIDSLEQALVRLGKRLVLSVEAA